MTVTKNFSLTATDFTKFFLHCMYVANKSMKSFYTSTCKKFIDASVLIKYAEYKHIISYNHVDTFGQIRKKRRICLKDGYKHAEAILYSIYHDVLSVNITLDM